MKRNHHKRPPRTVPGSSEDILAYLAAHGTHDKDTPAKREPGGSAVKPPFEQRKKGVRRMLLDLHGMKSEEAARRIRSAVDYCISHGINELQVIHGQGHHSPSEEGPVLKRLVREMLEHDLCSRIRSYRPGLPREGGGGVTVVTVR